MLCSMFTNVFASNKCNDSKKYDYVQGVLPYYLSCCEELIECEFKIELSNLISIDNREDSSAEISFIKNNGKYIGFITTTCVGDKIYSSYIFDNNVDVEKILNSGKSIGITVINNSVILFNDDLYVCIYGEKTDCLVNLTPAHQIIFNNVFFESVSRHSDYYIDLGIPHIDNALTPSGNGLCWAACLASVLNYRQGTVFDAIGIYNNLLTLGVGTPCGNNNWYALGYYYCGGLTCTCTGNMRFINLYNTLVLNKPAIFGLFIGSSNIGHAIVCKHLEGGNEYASYGFMDPNVPNTVYVHFEDPTLNPNNFLYPMPLGNYYWADTVF